MNTLIDVLLSIEYEVDTVPSPRLLASSSEDVDDIYQAKLEYNWWLDEKTEEYSTVSTLLGYPNRKLFPKSLRRIPN